MGKPSREKGKRGEREVAKILRNHGYEGRRGVQYAGGPDSPDVVGLPGIHLEVKRTERCMPYAFLEQAKNDADEFETPVVVHRQNGKQWIVLMDLDDFLELYARKEETKMKRKGCGK